MSAPATSAPGAGVVSTRTVAARPDRPHRRQRLHDDRLSAPRLAIDPQYLDSAVALDHQIAAARSTECSRAQGTQRLGAEHLAERRPYALHLRRRVAAAGVADIVTGWRSRGSPARMIHLLRQS